MTPDEISGVVTLLILVILIAYMYRVFSTWEL
jgi:hypothetical protein